MHYIKLNIHLITFFNLLAINQITVQTSCLAFGLKATYFQIAKQTITYIRIIYLKNKHLIFNT